MALGVPRLTTPRYSATRGHSVQRQYVPPTSNRLMPSRVFLPSSRATSVPPGLGMRRSRAISEPPIAARVGRRLMASPSPRRYDDYDYPTQYETSLAVHQTTNVADDADDLYYKSRARDRALLNNASNAVANASIKPAVSRRVASSNKMNLESQVDPDYISPLFPEYDMPERSTNLRVLRKSEPRDKLGGRPVGARAKVNLKRRELGRQRLGRNLPVPIKTSSMVDNAADDDLRFLTPPTNDYYVNSMMSIRKPLPRLPRVTKTSYRRSVPKAIVPPRVPFKPIEGGRYYRKPMSSAAKKGAEYGDKDQGRRAAIVVTRGKKYRYLKDHKTPLLPLYFDDNAGDSVMYSSMMPKKHPPTVVILNEPRTLIRSKKGLAIETSPPYKAALLAPTIEIESRRQRRPKSQYGAAKMRQLDLTKKDSQTAALHASSPGVRYLGDKKPIWTEDGRTKPANVLSWQHRIESKIDMDDGIYLPSSIYKLKDRLNEAQVKMDSHRALLDRYLDTDVKPMKTDTHSSYTSNYGTSPSSYVRSAPREYSYEPVAEVRQPISRKERRYEADDRQQTSRIDRGSESDERRRLSNTQTVPRQESEDKPRLSKLTSRDSLSEQNVGKPGDDRISEEESEKQTEPIDEGTYDELSESESEGTIGDEVEPINKDGAGSEVSEETVTDQEDEPKTETENDIAENDQQHEAEDERRPSIAESEGRRESQVQRRESQDQRRESQAQRRESQDQRRESQVQRRESQDQRRESQDQRRESQYQRRESQVQHQESQDQCRESKDQRRESQVQRRESQDQRRESQDQRRESQVQRRESQDQRRESQDQRRESQDQRRESKSLSEGRRESQDERRESLDQRRESKNEISGQQQETSVMRSTGQSGVNEEEGN